MLTNLKRCTKCVLPETHETIVFDDEGVCNICRQHEYKQGKIDWAARKLELDELVAEYKGKNDYDCIVPFSGGKDSTFTAYYLAKEYGLKPLLVRFDHGFCRSRLHDNTLKAVRKLGVELHVHTPNWKLVQQLMLQSFLEKGDFCWHCHAGIFAYPMWVAVEKKIPLIFWGEPSSEYTAYYSYDQPEEVDEKRFNRFINLGISAEDMFIRLGGEGIDPRDLKPFTYPPLKELRKINYRSVCLGSYIPWDVRKQVAIIEKELDWTCDKVENVPPGYEYEKVECFLQGTRDYTKYIKRGYTRPSHLTSLDIRNGRMAREEAIAIVDKYEGKRPPGLEVFLKYVGLTEEEYLEFAMDLAVSPYKHESEKITPGETIPDFEEWPRFEAMDREVALKIINRWRQRKSV